MLIILIKKDEQMTLEKSEILYESLNLLLIKSL